MAESASSGEPNGLEASSQQHTATGYPADADNMNVNVNITSASALDADEFGLYDRQIRLWGAQAQEHIRSAHILLISLRALGTEIAKNLTLAGISSLTIIDDEPVTDQDLGAQYFLRDDDVGTPVRPPILLFLAACLPLMCFS